MTKAYKSLVSLNYNLMASIDIETTGRTPGYHEIIQIAVQPLDNLFEPVRGINPFYMNIAPEFPERAEKEATVVHGLNLTDLQATAPEKGKVLDLFGEWFQSLELPFRKNLVMLAHNHSFEVGFLKAWMGIDLYGEYINPLIRDSMGFAIALNDRAHCRGEEPLFKSFSLPALCKQFGIENTQSHNALADAIAEAKVYKTLMQLPIV
jgi:DNA polymerase III epsilon subunit-like protein